MFFANIQKQNKYINYEKIKINSISGISQTIYQNDYVIYFYLEISLSTDLSALSPNAGKYGPEITPYLDTFHAVNIVINSTYFE